MALNNVLNDKEFAQISKRRIHISSICKQMGLSYEGKDTEIYGLNFCDRKSEYDHILTFITSEKYIKHINRNDKIRCVVLTRELFEIARRNETKEITYIITDCPETIFYKIHEFLYANTQFYDKFLFDARIGEKCRISPKADISQGVVIGNHVSIGDFTTILPGVVIEDYCEVGCNCIIGCDGFQLIKSHEENRLIQHTGRVRICEGTSISNYVTVCRSLFDGFTYIGRNVKIDNLVSISHNLSIGDGTVIVSGAFFCGGCQVGKNVWVGPNSTIMNKVKIGDYGKIGIGSVVISDVKEGTTVFGNPARRL
ncbi:hypothetical protein D3Z58_04240 [Clostridiaceae bacterium]|nr:hypothetical protein [Clostridiaceae bacterium]